MNENLKKVVELSGLYVATPPFITQSNNPKYVTLVKLLVEEFEKEYHSWTPCEFNLGARDLIVTMRQRFGMDIDAYILDCKHFTTPARAAQRFGIDVSEVLRVWN